MTEIANKIVEMDNLLPQTIKSRLIIHDYDKGDFSNQSAVNKSLVNSKAFSNLALAIKVWKIARWLTKND